MAENGLCQECGHCEITAGRQLTPDQALKLLIAGNERYINRTRQEAPGACEFARKLLSVGQWPFATVLCCSDSRVPPEIIFDVGVGDLFIVRIAGNILDSKLLGSIEYATLYSTSRLIMVMGHEYCGAINAAVKAVENPETRFTPGIDGIIRDLMPAVLQARKETGFSGEQLVDAAARENVRMTCRQIYERSQALREMIDAGDVKIVCGYKQLRSGKVEIQENGIL
jgi:carbonic anhydrase